MFRFTIRDVLWLTVVVAVACALFTSFRRCKQLEAECKRLEAEPARLRKTIQGLDQHAERIRSSHRQDLRAFQDEMHRVSGMRLKWWRSSPAGGVMPDERTYTFEYADDEPNQEPKP